MSYFGNRDTIGQRIRHRIENLPDPVSNTIKKIYRGYIARKIKLSAWWRSGRNTRAPLSPLKIYCVSPGSIEYASKLDIDSSACTVKNGDWDQSGTLFRDRYQYTSFYNRFVNNVDWEETEHFQLNNSRWDEYTADQLKEQHEYFDKLYEKINGHGYLSQHELEDSEALIEEIHDAAFHPPALREISVDVGRSGEILFGAGGQHRLAIAKILEVDEIPVRIRARHEEWQQKRDDIWTNPEQYDLDEISHPDLLHLLRKRTSSN